MLMDLRARAKITSHFGISSSDHFRQILKSKNLEIVHYYCAFCSLKSTKPNLNLSAKKVNLFLREPLIEWLPGRLSAKGPSLFPSKPVMAANRKTIDGF